MMNMSYFTYYAKKYELITNRQDLLLGVTKLAMAGKLFFKIKITLICFVAGDYVPVLFINFKLLSYFPFITFSPGAKYIHLAISKKNNCHNS